MTSSPCPIPSAISASSSASVPEETPMPWAVLAVGGDPGLQLLDGRPQDEVLALADPRDRGVDIGLQGLVLGLKV